MKSKEAVNKKEMVRQAAAEVIARDGFHDATIDKIAAAAGVAVGTIYNYFHNKDDILNYIFQNEYEKRRDFYENMRKQNIHPLEQLKLILTMHFDEVKKNPHVFRVLLQERHISRFCHFQGMSRFEGLPRFIEEILAAGISSGKLQRLDLKIITVAIFGAIEALMRRYLLELEENGQSFLLDHASTEILKLFWNGLARGEMVK